MRIAITTAVALTLAGIAARRAWRTAVKPIDFTGTPETEWQHP